LNHRDTAAVILALVLHVLLGVGLAVTPRRPPAPPRILSVDVRRREPPKVVAPPPPQPPPPEPPPTVKPKKPEVARAPVPNKTEPPREPPKEPPRPVFGVTMESTTEGDSSFVVPVGNTTIADPKHTGKPGPVEPLPAPVGKPAPDFAPVSPLDVTREAEPDSDDPISRTPYPEGEAKNLGIEGETVLRIFIDYTGRVHKVEIVKGVGGGPPGVALDRLAQKLAYKRKWKPAVDKRGKPVDYVVNHYSVLWQLSQ